MKLIFIILASIFIFPTATFAQQDPLENPIRPYIDSGDGRGVNPGDKKKSSNEIFENFLDIFLKPPQKDTGTSGTTSTPSSGTNISITAIPTPLNSLTPFPTTVLDLENPEGTLTYSSQVIAGVQNCLNNRGIYEQASARTGVSWQLLAAIHYMEGNCNPNQSLVSGRQIGAVEPDVDEKLCSSQINELGKPIPIGGGCGFTNLLSSAIYGANHLSGKIGKPPQTKQELAKAFSRYNGIWNSNCHPYTGQPVTPYQFCPPLYEGEAHIYAISKLDTKHENMYLIFCADGTRCATPQPYQRIGALTVVHIINNVLNVN